MFKCSSSLLSAQWRGYAKHIKSKISKAYQAQEKVTTLALLFLVSRPLLSPLSPKGCPYSVFSVAFDILKAACVREKGISRRREASVAWRYLEPFLGSLDLLPLLGVFLLNS